VVFLLPILITAYGLDLPLAVCALSRTVLALMLVGAYRAPLTPAGPRHPHR
jgi:hypothetical protein